MKKKVSILLSLIITAISVTSYSAFAAKAEKVSICHHTGNGGIILIVVSENAASAHIDLHGDFELRGPTCDIPLPQ